MSAKDRAKFSTTSAQAAAALTEAGQAAVVTAESLTHDHLIRARQQRSASFGRVSSQSFLGRQLT